VFILAALVVAVQIYLDDSYDVDVQSLLLTE